MWQLLAILVFAAPILVINTQDPCPYQIFSDLDNDACHAQNLSYIETDCTAICDFGPDIALTCERWWDTKLYLESLGGTLLYAPNCKRNGKYDKKQCKGEPTTGRCFCTNEEGERLDGQQWWDLADNMTCACSYKKYAMTNNKQAGSPYYISLHCDNQGNYEPLQCDVTSDMCWCANDQTGALTSPIVPMAFMTKLPCYQVLEVGTNYLRQCESQEHAQNKILHELFVHGVKDISYPYQPCDYDGSYGFFKKEKSTAYCTWKDNSVLGWQGDANHIDTLTCNCARDSTIFENSGRIQTQMCEGNGNYVVFQTDNKINYCVDADGYNIGNAGNVIKLPTDCDEIIPND